MAISFIGQATGTNTATMPAHQAGDLILVFAYNGAAATAPTLASGFTSISNSAANTNGHRLAYKVAASNAETVGTWTNASDVLVLVYRGCLTSGPIGGNATATNASATVAYPSVTMQVTNGSSWVAAFAGYRSQTSSLETPPTGFTNRSDHVNSSSDCEAAGHDTNGGVSSYAGSSASVGGSGFRYRTVSVELKAAATLNAYTLIAAGGSVSISGQAATLKRGAKVGAAAGSVAISGQAAVLRRGYPLVAAAGSVSITGKPAGTRRAATLGAAAGSLAIFGAAVTLRFARRVAASGGAISITGAAVALRAARRASAPAGSMSVAGAEPTLKPTRRLAAAGTAVGITGAAAELVYGSQTAFGIIADGGSIQITPSGATFRRSLRLPAGAGTSVLAASGAALWLSTRLASAVGSINAVGGSAALGYGRTVAAGALSVSITGVDALLDRTRRLVADGSIVAVIANDADLVLYQIARRRTEMSGSISQRLGFAVEQNESISQAANVAPDQQIIAQGQHRISMTGTRSRNQA